MPKTLAEKSHYHRDVSVFTKPRFQNVFHPQEKGKPAFSNFPGGARVEHDSPDVVAMINFTLHQYMTQYAVQNNMDFHASVNENSTLLIHEENSLSFLSNRRCSYETFKWSSSPGINVQDRVPRNRDQILVWD